MNESAECVLGQQGLEELPQDQVRGLAARDDLTAPEARLARAARRAAGFASFLRDEVVEMALLSTRAARWISEFARSAFEEEEEKTSGAED